MANQAAFSTTSETNFTFH